MIQRVTIKVDEIIKNKIISKYSPLQCDNDGEYILFFAKTDEFNVTVFTSKKENEYKVYFSGLTALEEAKKWDKNAKILESKKKAPTEACWEILDDQIGSDEVGTGDLFGPICVCAAFIKNSDIARLKKLGVDDSKRLTDDQIYEIGKVLINEFEYSQLSLNNEKYNELIDKNMNMNEIKAKMHNRCLLNLLNKHKDVKNILVDEFAKEKTYYSYLFSEPEVVDGITFKQKGETYFPSVAVGSIIARYSFIQHMDKLSDKYGMNFPYGASKRVTQFGAKFIKKFGKAEFDKVAKKNFANYKELTK